MIVSIVEYFESHLYTLVSSVARHEQYRDRATSQIRSCASHGQFHRGPTTATGGTSVNTSVQRITECSYHAPTRHRHTEENRRLSAIQTYLASEAA